MKRLPIPAILLTLVFSSNAQNPWKITAAKIDPSNYYGITVANGQIGNMQQSLDTQHASLPLLSVIKTSPPSHSLTKRCGS